MNRIINQKHFEYKVIHIDRHHYLTEFFEHEINELGKQGFELKCMSEWKLIFMREYTTQAEHRENQIDEILND